MLDGTGPSLDPLRFPRRKSVRLKKHDYTAGIYFITFCVHGRRPLLGSVKNAQVFLSRIGQIVEAEWVRSIQMRAGMLADAFVVMPDHFHGIVGLAPTSITHVGGARTSGMYAEPMAQAGSRVHPVRPYHLGRFVAGFKSSCTRQYRETTGWGGGALWQRGYYEHVIHGAGELERIRRYIADNPRKWSASHPDPAPPTRTHSAMRR